MRAVRRIELSDGEREVLEAIVRASSSEVRMVELSLIHI